MDIIVGTAGHIDHGKTSLVKALTGTDADRLPEEKHRGITIDLGFAELELGDIRFGFVDVPGHERFVKNMLAGASGIDLVLLVVAADEGIKPQTREHFDICRLLHIKNGLVAITKKDLVDSEMLELVNAEVAEFINATFLDGCAIVPVDSNSGDGLDELRLALASTARSVRPRAGHHMTRLPIDRSFAIKGFGTVVTGTLASGELSEADELDLLPVGRRVRVRGLQTHGNKVNTAHAGRRTAVNLGGIDHHEVTRGMLLAAPGIFTPSQIIDAHVEMLSDAALPLRTRQRVRVHIGTAETLARIAVIGDTVIHPGENGFAQLRLEAPVASILGERFILRSYSPQETVGGGSVLRPAGERVRRREAAALQLFLKSLYSNIDDRSATLKVLADHAAERGITTAQVRAITGWTEQTFTQAADQLLSSGSVRQFGATLIAEDAFGRVSAGVLATLEELHEQDRLSTAVSVKKLRSTALRGVASEIENAVLRSLLDSDRISIDRDEVKLTGRGPQLSDNEKNAIKILLDTISAAGLEVPKIDEAMVSAATKSGLDIATTRKLLQQLLDSGQLVRINIEFAFSSEVIRSLIAKLQSYAASVADRAIDVPTFKNVAGVSRKYAIPLLEYFDHTRVTVRRGDKRIIL